MRENMSWRCHVVLLLLCLHALLQTFAARPEDAVFIPGTLPPTDDGKEVPLTSAHLEMYLSFHLIRSGSILDIHRDVILENTCRYKHMAVGL